MNQTTLYQGRQISYSIEGSGNTLVFLHGYLEYKELWADFVKSFKDKFQIICIDLPGHGASESINTVHSMSDMADVVKYVLDRNGIEKFVLIGHSMGGYIALSFANSFSERLLGLIMFSSSSLNDSTEKIIARNRDIDLLEKGKKSVVINNNIPNMFATKNLVRFSSEIEKIKSLVTNMKESSIIAALEGMKIRFNYQNFLTTTPLPILFIAGRYDNLIEIDASKRQLRGAKNVRLKILENSGHMGYLEEEELSAEYILDFLSAKIFKG